MLGGTGVGGATTVTDMLVLTVPSVAVMLAVPAATGANATYETGVGRATPGTIGVGITVATELLEVLQVTFAVIFWELPSE
jgi:hypothetical protein